MGRSAGWYGNSKVSLTFGYDKWRYHYPEFDKAQTYVKVPPQDLF